MNSLILLLFAICVMTIFMDAAWFVFWWMVNPFLKDEKKHADKHDSDQPVL